MMLAASLLSATHAAVAVFSPSRNTCKKRLAGSMFRYDPYCARVLPAAIAATPAAAPIAAAKPAPVMPAAMSYTATLCETPLVSTSPVASATASIAAVAAVTAAPAAQRSVGPRFAIVQFKQESMTFLAPFRISAGDLVVVEGDRGENIGVVREIAADKPAYAVPNKVLRRATDKDREALAAQRQREAAVVKTTQAMAEGLGLRASIEDAEYQFDLNKLTIFVRRASKNAFVDFRKLQRGLFREFRCRIWCAYMDEVEEAECGERIR